MEEPVPCNNSTIRHLHVVAGHFGKLLRVAVAFKTLYANYCQGVFFCFFFNLMEKDSCKAPFMVRYDRHIILTFSNFRLDAIHPLTLNNATTGSRQEQRPIILI